MTETMEMVKTVPAEIENEVPQAVQCAKALTISNSYDMENAATGLKGIKGVIARIKEVFAPMKQKAHDAHKEVCNQEKALLDGAEQAERIYKLKMLDYQNAEEQKRLAEQRRIQAIADESARKERERLEQEAARQRAIEAEARAKAEQARREAEQADAAERKKLLAQAEAADRKAAAAAVKVEAKQEESAAVVAPVVQVQKAAPVSGVSTRKVWKHEITDLSKLLAYVFEHKREDLVLPNEKVIESYGKAMTDRASMPGVRFFQESILASKAR